MSLQNLMNPKPPSPPTGVQKFDDVLKEQKVPLRSWRKKYRKMKLKFDRTMEESNSLWLGCHKLDAIARRLQEENDQLLETLLYLNEIKPLYDLGDPHQDVVPSADAVPPLDDDMPRLLAQLLNVPHTKLTDDASLWPVDLKGQSPPGYMTTAYEEEYLANLDNHLDHDGETVLRLAQQPRSRTLPNDKDILNANPMSVLSWLRRHHPETFIQEKEAAAEKAGRSKGGAGGGGGKRASMATITSVANTGTPQPPAKEEGEDAEDEWMVEEKASGRPKKTKDDEAYRPKGGSSRPAKRKRGAVDGEEKSGRKRTKGGAATTVTPATVPPAAAPPPG